MSRLDPESRMRMYMDLLAILVGVVLLVIAPLAIGFAGVAGHMSRQ